MSAKWTFMVYVAGYNSLSSFAGKDLAEMRKVGSSDGLKVAVFVKRLEQQAAHRIIVGKDGKAEERENLGKNVDSGSPQTLLDFIRWAKLKAPAERYALIIWNHGSGWDPLDFDELYEHVKAVGVTPRELSVRATSQLGRSLFRPTLETALSKPNAGARAIASDDGTGHSLDTLELGEVLAKAHKELGRPLDLLGMDACLMSCLEVAYQSEKDVRAVVSSEELEPGDGWPYDKILADLRSNPSMDGAALGRVVVKRYIESYKAREELWPVTMCAIHSAGIEPFADVARRLHDGAAARDQGRRRRRHPAAARPHPQRALRRRPDRPRTLCEQVRSQPFETRGQDRGQEGPRRAQARRRLRGGQRQPRRERRALRRRDRLPAGADRRDLAVLQGPALRQAPRLGRVPALLPARGARDVARHA